MGIAESRIRRFPTGSRSWYRMKRPSADQSAGLLWLSASVSWSSAPDPPAARTKMSAWCLRSDSNATRDPSGDHMGLMLLLGPDVIFGFTAAITLGIFVGTYSSIYMSSPILIWLGVNQDSLIPSESRADAQDRKARGEA